MTPSPSSSTENLASGGASGYKRLSLSPSLTKHRRRRSEEQFGFMFSVVTLLAVSSAMPRLNAPLTPTQSQSQKPQRPASSYAAYGDTKVFGDDKKPLPPPPEVVVTDADAEMKEAGWREGEMKEAGWRDDERKEEGWRWRRKRLVRKSAMF
ncbi:hypothetical protein EDC01DRAFT_783670 [Geopyxis carbonaria]|nr:hypothetical protein EDC01DRAFT_783670 [Geopyxis carbonaria]